PVPHAPDDTGLCTHRRAGGPDPRPTAQPAAPHPHPPHTRRPTPRGARNCATSPPHTRTRSQTGDPHGGRPPQGRGELRKPPPPTRTRHTRDAPTTPPPPHENGTGRSPRHGMRTGGSAPEPIVRTRRSHSRGFVRLRLIRPRLTHHGRRPPLRDRVVVRGVAAPVGRVD